MATEEKPASNVIKAHPTKEFFLSMLIRDLTLGDAIGDLVDNAVDGANSLDRDNLKNYKINIEYSNQYFKITDNCGGIDAFIAQEYAFRFGRPNEYHGTSGSIGQFGIGMKRSLFKLGSYFSIKSKAKTTNFELEIDTDEWAKDAINWDFEFKTLEEKLDNPITDLGTTIEVTNLKAEVSTEFDNQSFSIKLIDEIEKENMLPISKGLNIYINGYKLKSRMVELYSSDSIIPSVFEHKFEDNVELKILAGIGESKLSAGGWYIFCNDRLILGPEQSEKSGWSGNNTSDNTPKYHGQYQMFRGLVFFSSEQSKLLPWNTTKNGLDWESPKYKFARMRMVEMMKPIITVLNALKEEKDKDSTFIQDTITAANKQDFPVLLKDSSALPSLFKFPDSPRQTKKVDGKVNISFQKPKSEVEAVKKSLKVKTLREVGELTFDYYYQSEIGE